MHLVAGAVQKAGVDESNAAFGRVNTGLQVDAGAALFVHDAELDGAAWQAQHFFNAREQFVGKSDFSRAVHLRFDDVNRAFAGVANRVFGAALQVVHGDGGGHHGVQNTFRDFACFALFVGVQNRRVRHQVANIAQEHERAAVQHDLLAFASRRRVDTVWVQAARHGLAAFFKALGQRPLQDAKPVAVGQHFVVGVDHGHRIFEVQNGRQCRFQHQVADTGWVAFADQGAAVDLNVEVQAVVLQQHGAGLARLALVTGELLGIGQAGVAAVFEFDGQLAVFDAVADRVHMRAFAQRCGAVQHVAGVGNDLGTALRVVAFAFFAAILFSDHVGAVQRVIQRAPARVGGVQCVARIEHRHHQLRAGLHSKFRVDLGGGDADFFRHLVQVTNFFQEAAVSRHVGDRAGMGFVPSILLRLQAVTLGQQSDIFWRQVGDDGVEAFPECGALDADAGQHALFDELVQRRGDLQAVAGGAGSGHDFS